MLIEHTCIDYQLSVHIIFNSDVDEFDVFRVLFWKSKPEALCRI